MWNCHAFLLLFCKMRVGRALRWGLLSQVLIHSVVCPFFFTFSKHSLPIEHRIHIWQISPQLSCCYTLQIRMLLKESDRIEYFPCGEINERSLSNPHLWLINTQTCIQITPPNNDFWKTFSSFPVMTWFLSNKSPCCSLDLKVLIA